MVVASKRLDNAHSFQCRYDATQQGAAQVEAAGAITEPEEAPTCSAAGLSQENLSLTGRLPEGAEDEPPRG